MSVIAKIGKSVCCFQNQTFNARSSNFPSRTPAPCGKAAKQGKVPMPPLSAKRHTLRNAGTATTFVQRPQISRPLGVFMTFGRYRFTKFEAYVEITE